MHYSRLIKIQRSVLRFIYPVWVLFASKRKVDRINKESLEKASEGTGEITILLHGILTNYYTAVYWAIRWFKRQGINVVSLGFDYEAELKLSAENIQQQIDHIRREYNIRKINLVGISLGGTVARYYVERCGGKDIVNKLVTIFTPLRSPDPEEFSLARTMEKVFGSQKTSSASLMQTNEIKHSHSVSHLAIYGTSDWIITKNFSHPDYDFPETTKFIQVPGGHTFVSYNDLAMEHALAFIVAPEELV